MEKELFIEEKLRTPVKGKYDVIVAGSGPAGVSAAVTAGRKGCKVLLIEQLSSVGGMSTTGMMSHWTGTVDSKFYREVLSGCVDYTTDFYDKEENKIYIDTEKLKCVYMEMLQDAKVDVLLYTFISDVVIKDGRIQGVIVENKSGRACYTSDVVIDCTGDGDVAYKCGVEYKLGRDDGKMQPATLMFKVGGVDDDRAVLLGSFESTYETDKGELQALAKKRLPSPAGHLLVYNNPLKGVVTVNMTNCTGVDGTLTDDLTKAEFVCRSQMFAIRDYLREYVPGFENCYILTSASMMGVRETRHFVGEYTITEDDISSAKIFPDWVVKGAYFNFDVHGITESGLDPTGKQNGFAQKNGYTIPYGCLIPKGIKGLLIAGRCISGTHIAHSNYRAMPICLAMGEAVGIASSIAVKKGLNVSEVDVKEIQAELL